MSNESIYLDRRLGFVTEVCFSCGVPFAMPRELWYDRKERGGSFFCPHGHSLTYGEGAMNEENRRLREQLEKESARLAEHKLRMEAEQRSHAATRGLLTKTKNRIGNGVCPCCNRSFTNLRRHMTTKHPEYPK